MNLRTENAQLKFLSHADFQEVLQLFHEPGTFQFIQHLENKTNEEYVSVLNNRLEQLKVNSGYHWVARSNQTQEFIGVLNLSRIPDTNKTQLGFQLSRNYWNKGLGLELAKGILDAGTNVLGYHTLYGICHQENIASRKILQRLNFRPDKDNFLLQPNIEIFQYIHELISSP